MIENTFNETTHQYGLWYVNDDNMACRKCLELGCDFEEVLPLSPEIQEEIHKQKEASIFLNAFQTVHDDDQNLMGYLNLILGDYVNYLDHEELNGLMKRMKDIETSECVDMQNAWYVNTLRENLISKDMDAFYDALEQLQTYNQNFSFGMEGYEISTRRTH